eukprot:TRINITY_DN6080_c0_g3_i1.p1 TRINITY_DN6080_c0_g3~~TRINITY_DN6080_c0_g3_i1.p1  ORF type:complete len:217 (-),score=35.91 TRINITY_DN6080_c0_g3_i1:198-848(-)
MSGAIPYSLTIKRTFIELDDANSDANAGFSRQISEPTPAIRFRSPSPPTRERDRNLSKISDEETEDTTSQHSFELVELGSNEDNVSCAPAMAASSSTSTSFTGSGEPELEMDKVPSTDDEYEYEYERPVMVMPSATTTTAPTKKTKGKKKKAELRAEMYIDTYSQMPSNYMQGQEVCVVLAPVCAYCGNCVKVSFKFCVWCGSSLTSSTTSEEQEP